MDKHVGVMCLLLYALDLFPKMTLELVRSVSTLNPPLKVEEGAKDANPGTVVVPALVFTLD